MPINARFRVGLVSIVPCTGEDILTCVSKIIIEGMPAREPVPSGAWVIWLQRAL